MHTRPTGLIFRTPLVSMSILLSLSYRSPIDLLSLSFAFCLRIKLACLIYLLVYNPESSESIHISDWVCTAVMSNDVMKDLRG